MFWGLLHLYRNIDIPVGDTLGLWDISASNGLSWSLPSHQSICPGICSNNPLILLRKNFLFSRRRERKDRDTFLVMSVETASEMRTDVRIVCEGSN